MHIGVIALVCIAGLSVGYMAGLDPLFLAVGVLALLGYLAFAGTSGYTKKPPEQRRPWYMD